MKVGLEAIPEAGNGKCFPGRWLVREATWKLARPIVGEARFADGRKRKVAASGRDQAGAAVTREENWGRPARLL